MNAGCMPPDAVLAAADLALVILASLNALLALLGLPLPSIRGSTATVFTELSEGRDVSSGRGLHLGVHGQPILSGICSGDDRIRNASNAPRMAR